MAEVLPSPPVAPVADRARILSVAWSVVPNGWNTAALSGAERPAPYLVVRRAKGYTSGGDFIVLGTDTLTFTEEQAEAFFQGDKPLWKSVKNALESFMLAQGKLTGTVETE
jgi:hypothetical protein